jgi:6-phosphofructokinase 2
LIATVTLNPCIDRVIYVHDLVLDETNRYTKLTRYAGGKGIDVSRAIQEMCGRTIAYGFVGGAPGQVMQILLDEAAVAYNFTPISQETRTNFIITDLKTKRQTRIDSPGPHISQREFERFQRKLRLIHPKPDLMVLGGSVPPGISGRVYHDMILEAKEYGVRCILDCDGQWLADGIKARPFLVKPNVREAQELLGRKLETKEDVIEAVLELVAAGVENAVISCGRHGLVAAREGQVVVAIPPEVKVRSLVGAGDCTVAGLALKLVENRSLRDACRLAVAMGTAAVMTPGNELCRRETVESLQPQVTVTRQLTRGAAASG